MSTVAPEPDDPVPPASGAVFWVGAALGAAIVAFGVHGLWTEERRGFASASRWFLGGALAVDLVIVPVGAGLGWLAKRSVAPWAWPWVRATLLTTVLLIAFAAPLVLGQGGSSDNETVRPRDYGSGLLLAIGTTWLLGAVGLAATTARRRAHRSRTEEPAR
jgi:hypothetical protein